MPEKVMTKIVLQVICHLAVKKYKSVPLRERKEKRTQKTK